MTIRSHDQYNTTIYGLNDRYRGIFGTRRVILMNLQDMASLGIEHGQKVVIQSHMEDGRKRQVSGFFMLCAIIFHKDVLHRIFQKRMN